MLLDILLHSMHFSSLFISLLLGFYILWRNSQQPLVCLMAVSSEVKQRLRVHVDLKMLNMRSNVFYWRLPLLKKRLLNRSQFIPYINIEKTD